MEDGEYEDDIVDGCFDDPVAAQSKAQQLNKWGKRWRRGSCLVAETCIPCEDSKHSIGEMGCCKIHCPICNNECNKEDSGA